MVIPFHACAPVRAFNRWMIKRRIQPRLRALCALELLTPDLWAGGTSGDGRVSFGRPVAHD